MEIGKGGKKEQDNINKEIGALKILYSLEQGKGKHNKEA